MGPCFLTVFFIFYSFECFLSDYFNDAFYVRVLQALLLPYIYGLLVTFIWMINKFRDRKKGEFKHAKSKLIGYVTILFIAQ